MEKNKILEAMLSAVDFGEKRDYNPLTEVRHAQTFPGTR
jgi:hypothetical protein